MESPSGKEWLQITAAAAEAGVPVRTAFRWVARGLLPVRKVGRSRLIEVGALQGLAGGRQAGQVAGDRATSGSGGQEMAVGISAIVARIEDFEVSMAAAVEHFEARLADLERRLESIIRPDHRPPNG